MRILIAEGEDDTAELIGQALRLSGHAVDRVTNGDQADSALRAEHFDVLILDFDLKTMSSSQVLARARSRGTALPVLALNGVNSSESRAFALNCGADDCMAKPFAMKELLARVRALIRRGTKGGSAEVCVGHLSFDLAGRTARVQRQLLDLTSRELEVLEIFVKRIDRLVSKQQLASELSRFGENVTTNAIEVYIHRLRRKLEASGVAIKTEKCLGYRFSREESSLRHSGRARFGDSRLHPI